SRSRNASRQHGSACGAKRRPAPLLLQSRARCPGVPGRSTLPVRGVSPGLPLSGLRRPKANRRVAVGDESESPTSEVSSSPKHPPVVALVEEAVRCLETNDWDALRRNYHPRARLTSVLVPRVLGPDEMIDLVSKAAEEPLYSFVVRDRRVVGAHGAIVRGELRYKRPDGFATSGEHVWLYVEQDGLVYRLGVYDTIEAAERAYVESAPTLGIPD